MGYLRPTLVLLAVFLTVQLSIAAPQDMYCPDHVPCGWAVYNPLNRIVVYIMHNTCTCQSPKLCLKSDDDLSANAYVHRCRERTSSTSSELSNG